MKAYKFRMLVREFNAALDTGRFDDITVEEVKRHAQAGTITDFLVGGLQGATDLSWMEPEDWAVVDEEWRTFAIGIDEGRKMAVENKGLCLLLAYALESSEIRVRQKLKDQQKAAIHQTG